MTSTEPASLELRSLDVTIDERQVLRNINLSVLPGELFVLLGGANSGKSTVLRAFAGLDPAAGARCDGCDCSYAVRGQALVCLRLLVY